MMTVWLDSAAFILFTAALAFCAGFATCFWLWWTGHFVRNVEQHKPIELIKP